MNNSYWRCKYKKRIERFGDSFRSCGYTGRVAFQSNQKNILTQVKKREGSLILDVGCGNGFFINPLLDKNKIIGIDIFYEMLKYAKEKGILAVQADATVLPFPNETFDLALCCGVAQHLDNFENCLEEIKRVIKKGGQIIISTLNRNCLGRRIHKIFEKDYKYLVMYDVEKILLIFRRKQLRNIKTIYLYYPFSLMRVLNKRSTTHDLLAPNFAIMGQK